jgi:hypothetical protein
MSCLSESGKKCQLVHLAINPFIGTWLKDLANGSIEQGQPYRQQKKLAHHPTGQSQ